MCVISAPYIPMSILVITSNTYVLTYASLARNVHSTILPPIGVICVEKLSPIFAFHELGLFDRHWITLNCILTTSPSFQSFGGLFKSTSSQTFPLALLMSSFNPSIKSKLLLYIVELHEFDSKVYREIVRCLNIEYKRCPYCNRELSHFDDTGAVRYDGIIRKG